MKDDFTPIEDDFTPVEDDFTPVQAAPVAQKSVAAQKPVGEQWKEKFENIKKNLLGEDRPTVWGKAKGIGSAVLETIGAPFVPAENIGRLAAKGYQSMWEDIRGREGKHQDITWHDILSPAEGERPTTGSTGLDIAADITGAAVIPATGARLLKLVREAKNAKKVEQAAKVAPTLRRVELPATGSSIKVSKPELTITPKVQPKQLTEGAREMLPPPGKQIV